MKTSPFLYTALVAIGCCTPIHAGVFSDNFDSGGQDSAVWVATEHARVRGTGEPGFKGSHALWFDGGQAGWGVAPRSAATVPFNTTYGATLSFNIKAGDDSYIFWEQPEAGEGVRLEFKVGESSSWRTLRYLPIDDTPAYGNWSTVSIDLPAVALAPSVRFRLEQRWHSGAGWDHWAIDDFQLSTEVPVGTAWSQVLPPGLSVALGRVNPAGGFEVVLDATADFELGDFSGSAGWYLGKTGSDGSWQRLTGIGSNAQTASFSDMTVDDSGNLFLCGSYRNPIFGLPADYSSPNAFVVKYSASHELAWAQAGFNLTSSTATFSGVCVDDAGKVTVAGRFHSLMRFGPNGFVGEPELNSGDTDSSLIARYDSGGNYQWSLRIGDDEFVDPNQLWGIRCDAAGDLYLFGNYMTALNIPPFTLGKPVDVNPAIGFLLKCNASGVPQWLTHLGFSSDIRDVAVGSGFLYVTGAFGSAGAEFSPKGEIIPGAGEPDSEADDLFLLNLDPANASVDWVRTAGPVTPPGAGLTLGTREALRLDESGNVYLIYPFSEDHLLAGATTVTHFPAFNHVLTRWSPAGELGWHKRASATIATADLDAIGQMYVGGGSGSLAVLESAAVLGDPSAPLIYKFNNIFEATSPVAVSIERETIPADWGEGSDLGPLVVVDADGAGTYAIDLMEGDGDDQNSLFILNAENHLLLAPGARLAEGDMPSLRLRVTDEAGVEADSVVQFMVIEPSYGQWVQPFTLESGAIDASRAGPDGSLYLSGYFYGTLTIGEYSVVSEGSYDWFVARLDAEGTPLWVVRCGGADFDRAWNLDVDAVGNVYVASQVVGDFTLSRNGSGNQVDAAALATGGGRDACIVSLTGDGNFRWLNLSGGDMDDTPRGIQVDDLSGRCVVAGSFSGDYNLSGRVVRDPSLGAGGGGSFSGASLPGLGVMPSAFVLSYDGVGNLEWGRAASGNGLSNAGTSDAFDAAIDSQGATFIVGRFKERLSFAGNIQASSGTGTTFPNYDVFLWKLDDGGVTSWVRKGGNPVQNDEGLVIGIDAQDRPSLAGRIFGDPEESATFGTVSFVPGGGYDVVTVRYTGAGVPVSGHQIGGAGYEVFTGLTVLPNGELLIGATGDVADGSGLPGFAYQHYFAADGERLWSGDVYNGDRTAFAPNLMPLIAGKAFAGQEIAGVVLPSGPFAARINGPTPVREPPTAITLAPAGPAPQATGFQMASSGPNVTVPENQPAKTIVAHLEADDADSASFTFQLIGGEGADGNPAFRVVGDQLVTTVALNYEEIASYPVRLRVIDDSGLTHEQAVTIDVGDLPDTLSATFTITELIHNEDGEPHGATVVPDPRGLPFTVTYDGLAGEPVAAGPYALVAAADHPEYAGSASATFWIRDILQQWLAGYLAPELINDSNREADVWGWSADADGDGVVNASEFYFQGDPSTPDAGKSRLLISRPDPEDAFEFSWMRRKGGPTATLLWSSDLQNWYASGEGPPNDTRTIVVEVVEDLGTHESMRATFTNGGGDRAFLRVAIQLP